MTADPPDFCPLRIFLIEDQRDSLEALQIYLEQSGHVVFSARNKAEALREIPRANCHVLVSDINLPDGNGWDLMQEVGKLCPDYAIAISGHGMKADRERSAESGFRHHLVKPISAQKLDTLLQEATTELGRKKNDLREGEHFKPGATRPSSQFPSPVRFAFPDTSEPRSPRVGH